MKQVTAFLAKLLNVTDWQGDEIAAIIASSSDAIISQSLNGSILTWNTGAQKILGYAPEEIKGKNFSLLVPPELLQAEGVFTGKILKGEAVEHFETVRVRKDQSYINVSITRSAIRNKAAKVVGILNILRDITPQKKAELELLESNNRNKILIREAPNAIAMFDTSMRYLAASKKWMTDYSLEGKEIVGHSHYEIFPEIGDDWKAIHEACLKGAINQCDEAMFERADGAVQWLAWDVRPWYTSPGNIGGIIMYTADITHIKEKDSEQRRIQQILDKTNNIARIGHWEFDVMKSSVKWSRVIREIHEVAEDFEPDLNNAIDFFKEGPSRVKLREAVANALKDGTTYDLELEILTGKGNTVWVRTIGQAEFQNGVCKRLYGVFQDIDEIKRSRDAVNLLNLELSTFLDAGHVSIIGTDKNGLITHFSRGAEILLQYKAAEIIGIHTPSLIHLADEAVARGKALSMLYNKPIEGFDVFTYIPNQGEHESREWTYVRKDGSTFPVQLVVSAIRNFEGDTIGYIGVATDISVIKKAEKEMKSLLQITTDQNDRLKNFAHIVSHNLRSHSGNIEMILQLYLMSDPAAIENEYIAMLKTSAGNLQETIDNLNEAVLINTASGENLTPVNLHRAIAVAANNVSVLAAQASVAVINNTGKEFFVLGLPAYIDSILLNFISNGIKYRASNRECYVELSATVQDDFLILTVEDNGLGIDLKRNGAKLFGMYKTFHGNSDARGIGLFITKNQVEAIGGKIEVESEPGKGTTFRIWFHLYKH